MAGAPTGAPADAPARAPARVPTGAPRRVLILKPCCMGDVLMATPLVASLAAAWPEASIDWAVGRHSRPVLEGNPHVAALIDATGCVRGSLDARSLARLAIDVRRGRYDMAFVPDRSPLMALVPLAAGVPVRVGLDSGNRGRVHTVRVSARTRKPETELYLDLTRAVGVATAAPIPIFVPSDKDRREARQQLAGVPDDGTRVALHPSGGVNPGMALPEKRWPPACFAELMDRLVAEYGARIFVLGGGDDAAVSRSVIAAAAPDTRMRTVDVTGRLGLGAVAALVASCDLYVGNDSGAAHLAAAVGTPTVVVFGPTDPVRYGPPPGGGIAVGPLEGTVDRLSAAVGSRAIEAVTVDAVWGAARELLAG